MRSCWMRVFAHAHEHTDARGCVGIVCTFAGCIDAPLQELPEMQSTMMVVVMMPLL